MTPLTGDQDEAVLVAIRNSIADVDVHTPLDAVISRGHRLRRRRRATRAAVSAASAAALAVVIITSVLTAQHGSLTADGHQVNVDLAAWSVHTTANATVTVTVRDPDLSDPDRLRTVLAQAGVPASIQVTHVRTVRGTFIVGCAGPGQDGMPQVADVLGSPSIRQVDGTGIITIKPSAMPPGSVLSFVFFVFDGIPKPPHRPLGTMSLHQGPPPPCIAPTAPPQGAAPAPYPSNSQNGR
jgi:hypothetical protein